VVLINWTPELIQQVKEVRNKTSCTFDYWLDSVLGGYVTKFSIDFTQSYSAIERELFKGPCGRYLKSMYTWINMLLCKQGMMTIESNC